MDWLDEIEARGNTGDLGPDDVYRLITEVRTLRADLARAAAERDAAAADVKRLLDAIEGAWHWPNTDNGDAYSTNTTAYGPQEVQDESN